MMCFFRTTDSQYQMSGRTSRFDIITQIQLFDLAGPHTLDRVLTVYTKSAPCVCVCVCVWRNPHHFRHFDKCWLAQVNCI